MPKDKTIAAKIYGYVGLAGAVLLAIGCFCPIDAGKDYSAANLFLIGLSDLGGEKGMAAGLQVLLSFGLLLVAGRSLLGAGLGEVHELRITAVQVWVVILVFYWYYFGSPLPLHLNAGWGWSVLYLGATLLTFGSFRLAMELEEDEEEQAPSPRKRK